MQLAVRQLEAMGHFCLYCYSFGCTMFLLYLFYISYDSPLQFGKMINPFNVWLVQKGNFGSALVVYKEDGSSILVKKNQSVAVFSI
jgi:hypothetical protein